MRLPRPCLYSIRTCRQKWIAGARKTAPGFGYTRERMRALECAQRPLHPRLCPAFSRPGSAEGCLHVGRSAVRRRDAGGHICGLRSDETDLTAERAGIAFAPGPPFSAPQRVRSGVMFPRSASRFRLTAALGPSATLNRVQIDAERAPPLGREQAQLTLRSFSTGCP